MAAVNLGIVCTISEPLHCTAEPEERDGAGGGGEGEQEEVGHHRPVVHRYLTACLGRYTDLEGQLREDLMMARIRDTENSQCVAELTQKISNLEFKVKEQFYNSFVILRKNNCS